MSKITISLDAMGGDYAPTEQVIGAGKFTKEVDNCNVILVGDEVEIKKILDKNPHNASQIEILHTSEFVGNDDSPKEAIRSKPKASILLAADLVGKKEANAVVGSGNTGAVILACAKKIPRIPGVSRTALTAVYPTQNKLNRKDSLALMLDVGANIHCDAEELFQFALMGSAYSSSIQKVKEPLVGLLNMGSESHKGNDSMVNAHRILSESSNINFYGNIEGNNLMQGIVDVVVCEGIIGNIALKSVEGVAEVAKNLTKQAFKERLIWKMGIALLSGGIKQLKNATDFAEYGGAPILGFSGICIKAHGRSGSRAIKNALKVAFQAVQDKVCERIEEKLDT